MNADLPYLHSPEALPDWSQWPVPSPQITKIVIGKLNETLEARALPDDFAERFPNLKLLHLWGLEGLTNLPELPAGLEELDVRKCPDLEEVPDLPEGLEVLVVGNTEKLQGLDAGHCGKRLVDVCITDCPALAGDDLVHLLEAAPKIEEVYFSGCGLLTELPRYFPESLRELKANRCEALEIPPEYWPSGLRRLELAGSAIKGIPSFPPDLDYVNLSACRKLEEIPKEWIHGEHPRTLFLAGSAVKSPPASEHGEEGENVAEKTRSYFREKELVGEGEVRRCKVLLIGNGHAGKTTLNLALTGKDPKKDNPGSTHGIQFVPWPMECVTKGRPQTLLRHIWDFGGQEIYHNTHQLFMRTGAIFVLLWDPTQDGQQAPETKEGYADEWRPLRYWVDYLKLYGPSHPKIAVVCNCRPELGMSEEKRVDLEAEFHRQLEGLQNEPPLYFSDVYEKTGDLPGIGEWIDEKVIEVVEAQGSSVPAYWELAQDMVEGWVEADSPKEMSLQDFQDELQERLDRIVKSPGRFHRLAHAMRSGAFSLNKERVASTLGFLTNSGWIYWDAKLFQERVIISQKWALEGIYAALDRRPGNTVYEKLVANEGLFTKAFLKETAWGRLGLTEGQEELLLSYLQQVGNCFTLIQAKDRWEKDAVYVSLAHLKTVKEQGWEGQVYGNASLALKEPKEISCEWLHPGHWHRILARLGQIYGREARYAKDGFFLDDPKRQSVLVRMVLNEKGIGGRLELLVHSTTEEMTREIEDKMVALIASELPTSGGRAAPKTESSHDPAGPVPEKIKVFVSYSWNPRRPEMKDLPKGLVEEMTEDEVPDYEGPVDYIEDALKDDEEYVDLLRDQNEIGAKDIVMNFINKVKTSVVHAANS